MIKRVLNLGAGVQSTTVYLMACANRNAEFQGLQLPWPEVGLVDVAIFADTGDEPRAVYRHLDWLVSLSGVPILIRSKGKLSSDLKNGCNSTGQRFASIPAFTSLTEGVRGGMVRRQCSKEYKIEVIMKTLRREVLGLLPKRTAPKGTIVYQLYGISLDEAGRAQRIENAPRAKYLNVEFPLVRMRETRQSCVTLLSEHFKVPHETPRSACVHCPFHTDAEWLRVQAVPEDWELAVGVDESLRSPTFFNRQIDQKMYLHRSCRPLVQIEFKPAKEAREQQININFSSECLGVCGV